MKYGIIENNQFIFIDENMERLKNTLSFIGKTENDIVAVCDDEIEQGYNNQYYLKGFAPIEPAEQVYTKQIDNYKKQLSDTDYIIVKIAEGVSKPEEYAEIITQRQYWRAEINRLEELLAQLPKTNPIAE